MERVRIVTDSTACLPQELVEQYGIYVVPLDVIFGRRVYRDGIDLGPKDFYRLLGRAEVSPTTSASSPGTYLQAFREAAFGARGIVCVTVSAEVSGMYDSARQAAELAHQALPQVPIRVMDSRTATMAQGFVVLEAARAAHAGMNVDEIVRTAQGVASRVEMVATIDTFDYLVCSGRVPKAAAWAASLLNIKPVLAFAMGEVHLVKMTRTRATAVKGLLAHMEQRLGKTSQVHVAVVHADAAAEAEFLREEAASRFDCIELYLVEFTPGMAVHTGPGVLCLCFYPHLEDAPQREEGAAPT